MNVSCAHWGDLQDGTPVELHTLSHESGVAGIRDEPGRRARVMVCA